MTVYLDGVLVLNSLVDYLLLMVCGNVTGTPVQRKRVLLAGLIGGVYAILCLLPEFSFLDGFLWKVLMAWCLCLFAFGRRPGMIRRSAVLILLAAAFSGVVLLLTEFFAAPASLIGSTVYYPVTLPVLALTAGGSYGLMQMALSRLSHQGGDIVNVEVTLCGVMRAFTALRDTGNTLRDPISGLSVMVADWNLLASGLYGGELTKESVEEPTLGLSQMMDIAPELKPRLIPYKTVGVESGLLLAVCPEEIKVDGKKEQLLLAFSAVPVSDGGGYEALIGGTQ